MTQSPTIEVYIQMTNNYSQRELLHTSRKRYTNLPPILMCSRTSCSLSGTSRNYSCCSADDKPTINEVRNICPIKGGGANAISRVGLDTFLPRTFPCRPSFVPELVRKDDGSDDNASTFPPLLLEYGGVELQVR